MLCRTEVKYNLLLKLFFSFVISCHLSFLSTVKRNLNRSPMSIKLDHDGFKRGSITSAWLRKHLHCLPCICHVWFSCLPVAYGSILITDVKLKITNKANWRFDQADIYSKQASMRHNKGFFLFPAVQISEYLILQYYGSRFDITLILNLFCCFAKVYARLRAFVLMLPTFSFVCISSSHYHKVYNSCFSNLPQQK